MLFMGGVAVPLVAVFSTLVLGMPHIFVPMAVILFFFGGLLRMLYAHLFEESDPPPPPGIQREAISSYPRPSLLPQPGISATRDKVNTAEIAPPDSVTENTTKLL
jgi:hypothetical protein